MPVQTDGNSDRDKMGVDDDEEQQVRGPQRDELWVTPDTREAWWRPTWSPGVEDRAPGHHEFPAGRLARTGTRNPDVEVVILADGTLESATIVRSSGSAKLDQAVVDILKLASPFDPFPKELADRTAVAFHLRLGVQEGRRSGHGDRTGDSR